MVKKPRERALVGEVGSMRPWDGVGLSLTSVCQEICGYNPISEKETAQGIGDGDEGSAHNSRLERGEEQADPHTAECQRRTAGIEW